jgi:hypothetical protein
VPSFDSGDVDALKNLAGSFANHPDDWNNGCEQTSPCGWVNNSPDMYPDEVRHLLQANQTLLFTYNPGDCLECNPWLIPSGCVATYWLDENNRDLSVVCPAVR